MLEIEYGGDAHHGELWFLVKEGADWQRSDALAYEGSASPDSMKDFLSGVHMTFRNMYHRGRGVSRNDGEALKWNRLAADQGDSEAQFSIGMVYLDDMSKLKDHAEAERWLDLAASYDSYIQVRVGKMYLDGRSVPSNPAKALSLFQLAAKRGNYEAAEAIGDLYVNGIAVGQDDHEAATWYRVAIDRSSIDAIGKLGLMYATGRGEPRNQVVARALFNFAGRLSGVDKAQYEKEIQNMTPEQVKISDAMSADIEAAYIATANRGNQKTGIMAVIDRYASKLASNTH